MINVVAAYLTSGATFLITKRAKGELKGLWEFPGGKVEPNEDNFSAIKREIKEELDLDITPLKEIKAFTYKYTFADIYLTLIHCTLSTNAAITSDGSHNSFQWISINEAEAFKFAPLDQQIIDLIKLNKTEV